MNTIHFIAFGANLGTDISANGPGSEAITPRQSCERALRGVASLPGLVLQARSRWFSTAPVPPGQPRYVNGVARLAGAIAPSDLLAELHRLEEAAGRVRGAPNAPRTLDLDIIDMAGMVRHAPDPILPHPRTHLRAFVLLPLRDVAPCWVHPVLGTGIGELLASLGADDRAGVWPM